MKKSIVEGKMLPETEGEYVSLREKGNVKYLRCGACNQPFHHSNTFTTNGWMETQISGMCESCFDELFQEKE